ncbi:MAG: hypothetical protein AB1610_09670 [Nitrospirota bacterium]
MRKKGDGETIEHFVAYGPLSKHFSFDAELQHKSMKLDGSCHEDYAQKLIPRAVGYSAGLLDYFFRGDIDIIRDDESCSGYMIVNNTDEDMSGTFEIWYDDENEERKSIWSKALTIQKRSKSTHFDFTPAFDAKEFCKYILVFRGQMGQENDAVIGKIINLEDINACYLGAIINARYTGFGQNLAYNVTITFNGGKTISEDIKPIMDNQRKGPDIIRFAEGNPFIFGVLSTTSPAENSYDYYYTVDLFEIDKKLSKINYLGEVLRISNPRKQYQYRNRHYPDEWIYEWYYQLDANDLFISNDGKTVKVIGLYGEFKEFDESLFQKCSAFMPNSAFIKFEGGYFINENRYLICTEHGDLNAYSLNPDELYLEYYCWDLIDCGYTQSGASKVAFEKYWYNYEVKVAGNVLYSKNGTYTRPIEEDPSFDDAVWFDAYALNFILKRDKGYSLSLRKMIDNDHTLIMSYCSEGGVLCEHTGIKNSRGVCNSAKSELISSMEERVYINSKYTFDPYVYYKAGYETYICLSPSFEECFENTKNYTAGYSRDKVNFNNTDITFWRNWREQH